MMVEVVGQVSPACSSVSCRQGVSGGGEALSHLSELKKKEKAKEKTAKKLKEKKVKRAKEKKGVKEEEKEKKKGYKWKKKKKK